MKKLYNIKEVAETLSVKQATVRSWIFQKKLPVVKLSRAVRVKESVLEGILEGGLEAVSGGA